MADPVYWDDAYPIALLLKEVHPGVDPVVVKLDVLHGWVIQLEGFADDRAAKPTDCLEQIQVEWVELA